MGKVTAQIRVADEVRIAAALLQREHPDAVDFNLKEIEARLAREGLTDTVPARDPDDYVRQLREGFE